MAKYFTSNKSVKILPWYFLIPVIVMASVVPLIVRLQIVAVNPEIQEKWLNETTSADFFSYWKSIVILTAAVASLILFFLCLYKGYIKIKITLIYIPLGLFTAFIILSTVFSKYPASALFGIADRCEGMWILLSYIAGAFAAYNLINDKRSIEIVLYSICISSFAISCIGILQYSGMDIFESALGRFLFFPDKYRELAVNLTFRYGEGTIDGSSVCSTLYNSNTLGNYLALVIPLLIAMFIYSDNRIKRLLTGIMCTAAFACLIAAQSRGGFLGAFIAILLLAVLLYKKILESWRKITALVLTLFLAAILTNYLGDGSPFGRLVSVLKGAEPVSSATYLDKIRDLDIKKNEMSLYCKNIRLKAIISDKGLTFMDDAGKKLRMKPMDENNKFSFEDERYKSFIILVHDNLISIEKDKSFLNFAVLNNTFAFVNVKGRVIEQKPIDQFGFNGIERMGSSRGYIWSRTIPLLKRTVLLGYGPDTFVMSFPQDDYMGKLNNMYDANIIIDKPHNLFLQIGVNTGVISLLVFLLLMSAFFFKSMKTIKQTCAGYFEKIIGTGLLAAVAGYLISGLFTDSTVSVSPVFWVIFGLGLCTVNITKPNKVINF